MQRDNLEIEMPKVPRLNELDSALNELGMLATCTESRRDYLREIENRTREVLNMLTINTRYVSNVSIGFKVRPGIPRIRYKPYSSTKRREERHRTKSENNDTNDSTNIVKSVLEEKVTDTIEDLAQLKKAKSLESIVLENNPNADIDKLVVNLPELETVSTCIENLKIDE